MSRERLTSRTAEELKAKPGAPVEAKGSGIDNDPYDMNDTGHSKNDPKVDEYAKGDPSAWGEDVNKDKANKDDGKREETGHAPLIDKHAAAEAIASAKRLEERAVKCIIAAQRILPGASEELIEKQAAILLNLPEEGINATLANQEELARQIGKQASDVADEAEDDKPAEKEAGKDEKENTEKEEETTEASDESAKKLDELKKMASDLQKQIEAMDQNAKANKNWPEGKKAEKKANDDNDEDDQPAEKECDKAAGDSADKPKTPADDDADKADKKEEKAVSEETVDASDANLLDQIFSEVTASDKKGASSLSGMVKKEASSAPVDNLSSLWKTDPDVSSLF